jgi:predicted secreted hydrolase
MIRRAVLILLMAMLLMAAGCMTALFIFRQPTPAAFAQASIDRPVSLPCDQAAHGDYVTEWWYYTGFLTGDDGRERGFELVFFKVFLPPEARIGGVVSLNWISNPLYFAHFALADPEVQQHEYYTQANLPRFWDAGARRDRYRVWNGDWQAWSDMQPDGGTCSGGDRHHIEAAGGPYALQLDLDAAQPAVAHGFLGSGAVDMGQAGTSYYYSYPDLQGYGWLTVNGQRQVVKARAWMDHQWGSWTTHGLFAGWDWFSLRLADRSRVMLFAFRNRDGSLQPESAGTWIGGSGTAEHLAATDFQVQVLERWTSPDTGASYPVKWQVAVPDHGLDVTVAATFPEQELITGLGPNYWEGSVVLTGTVSGDGFVEMTGY